MNNKPDAKQNQKADLLLFLLLLFSLILPALDQLLLFSASYTAKVFGALYSYSVGGSILYILGEILEALYEIVAHIALSCAWMTIGAKACKKGFKKGIGFAGIFLGSSLAVEGLRIGLYALLTGVGVSDSTVNLAAQLPALLATYAVNFFIRALVVLLVAWVFSLIEDKGGKKKLFASPKTPYMICVYILLGLYSLFLMGSALPLALDYDAAKESFFAGIVMPFVYPLIYSGLIFLAASLYRDFLDKRSGQKRGKKSEK